MKKKAQELYREMTKQLEYKAKGWRFNSYFSMDKDRAEPTLHFMFSSPSRSQSFDYDEIRNFADWLKSLLEEEA